MPAKELAQAIRDARTNLDALYEKTKDPKKKKALVKQMEALDGEIQRLIAHNIQAAGAEYDGAVLALEKANQDLEKALESAKAFASAVAVVASAIDAVAKVVAV